MLLIIGNEHLTLQREVAERLILSNTAIKKNHQRQAVIQLKIGVALIRKAKFFNGLKYILAAVVKDPSSLIFNGVVRKRLSMLGSNK
jgi:hypothetical protein